MSTFVDELTEERGGGGIDGQNVVSYNNSSVSRYETTSVSSEESKTRTNLINNERGLPESSRGPAAFNYFPSEICTAIREGLETDGATLARRWLPVDRGTRKILPLRSIFRRLSPIFNREISRDWITPAIGFTSRDLSFGKSRETKR